jgi:hypothetical protein
MTTHGRNRTKTYQTWGGMIQRCTNPKAPYYECYGGRGITVCDRWRNSFEDFLADMGEKPKGLTIDRIDVNKGYSPENCRWADLETQARNTSRSRTFTRNGVTKHLFEWAEESDVPLKTIETRLLRGWEIEAALTVPVGAFSGNRRRPKSMSKFDPPPRVKRDR